MRPVASWIRGLLVPTKYFIEENFSGPERISADFANRLNILFREQFPTKWSELLIFLFCDKDRIINFIAFCLQNIATTQDANELEMILADGGSAWTVTNTFPEPHEYQYGDFDLTSRVPSVVESASQSALDENGLLKEAWVACYSKNPDYEKAVSKCVDFLEGMFKKHYFPKIVKPNLTLFVNDFEQNPSVLNFKGSSLLNPTSAMTILAKTFVSVRGQHTSGQGRIPTKEEAEFVLHYTIFCWNMHARP